MYFPALQLLTNYKSTVLQGTSDVHSTHRTKMLIILFPLSALLLYNSHTKGRA